MRKLFSCSSLDNLRKHYLRLSIDCANEYYSQHSKSSGIYETFLEAGAKFPSAQTPHLLRNHCPFRKAQRPPGQVSEIKQFAFENGSQIEAYFKHDVCLENATFKRLENLQSNKYKTSLGSPGPRSRISFSADTGRVVQQRPRRKELIGRCIFHALISFQMVPSLSKPIEQSHSSSPLSRSGEH